MNPVFVTRKAAPTTDELAEIANGGIEHLEERVAYLEELVAKLLEEKRNLHCEIF
jgi:hypothetical protein